MGKEEVILSTDLYKPGLVNSGTQFHLDGLGSFIDGGTLRI